MKKDPKVSAVLDIIFEQIKKLEVISNKLNRLGYVESVADGVVRVRGMAQVAYGEMVAFPQVPNLLGFTCNLNKDSVDILIFGDEREVKAGYYVIGRGHGLKVPITKKC